MNKPTSDIHALFIGLIAGAARAHATIHLLDDDDGAHQDTFLATFAGQEYLVTVVPR